MGQRNSAPLWAARMGYARKVKCEAQRQFARYRVRYPDGTSERARTSFAIQPIAQAVCWRTEEGSWQNSGVYDTPPAWASKPGPHGPYQLLDAERIG